MNVNKQMQDLMKEKWPYKNNVKENYPIYNYFLVNFEPW
jgi:hypothetical protein